MNKKAIRIIQIWTFPMAGAGAVLLAKRLGAPIPDIYGWAGLLLIMALGFSLPFVLAAVAHRPRVESSGVRIAPLIVGLSAGIMSPVFLQMIGVPMDLNLGVLDPLYLLPLIPLAALIGYYWGRNDGKDQRKIEDAVLSLEARFNELAERRSLGAISETTYNEMRDDILREMSGPQTAQRN